MRLTRNCSKKNQSNKSKKRLKKTCSSIKNSLQSSQTVIIRNERVRLLTIEELKVLISAETNKLNKELDKVKGQLTSVEKQAKSTSSGIQKAFSAIKVTAIIAGLVKVGKAAINAASDLAEVQNVVDTSFGKAADEVDKFAKTAITKFGLSEFAAKQSASSFMAMSNGMGVANKAGSEMAITLAGLSGDLASFWNTSAEQAQTALKGVYTGETEALKKYGVVMSEANLANYAAAQGIKKQLSAMTQAEKVQLRYNYVMQATADAQGDFAKTSGSWSNQVKILCMQFQQLASIIGNGLIAALTPAIKMFNQLLTVAINVANTVSDAFSKIFGSEQKQVLNLDTTKAADSIDQTTGAVEDLNKSLGQMSFDELNTLGSKSKETAGNVQDQTLSVNTTTSEGDKGLVKNMEEQSSQLEKILQTIADKIKAWKEKLPKLEIQFDTDQVNTALGELGITIVSVFSDIIGEAANFGINLANSINFSALVTNLAAAGQNLISTFGTIATTIIQLANRIAQDINLGLLIEKVSQVIAAFTGFVDKLVSAVAPAVVTFYNTAISPLVQWVGEKLADALDFAAGLLNDWGQWFSDNAPLIQKFAEDVGNVIANIWLLIEPLADATWQLFKDVLTLISEAIQASLGWILEHGEAVASVIAGVLAALLAYKIVTTITAIITGLQTAIGGLSAAFTAISANPVGLVVAAIAGLIVLFTSLWQNCEGFRNFWIGLWDNITSAISSAWETITGIIDGIINGVKNAINAVKEFFGFGNKNESRGNGFSGGGGFGGSRSYRMAPANIPALASGGALYSSAVVQAGEYPGANTNPEIVAPQSLMKETMEGANAGVINAVMAMGSQITKAIEEKDTNVYMDTTKVTRKVTKEQAIQKKQGGSSLVNI